MKLNLAQVTRTLPLLRVLLGLTLVGGVTVARAQLTFPTELVNVLDNTPIDQSAKKIVVLIHGWTAMRSEELPANYNRYEQTMDAVELNYAYNALRLRLQGSDWRLIAYRWETDASTGFIDFGGLGNTDLTGYARATQAALNARAHGAHLGNMLAAAGSSARFIHFIAHSAGAWVAREAMRVQLESNSFAVVQLTLLDPFIPDALRGMGTGLSGGVMSATATLSDNQRIFSLENYYADDFPLSVRVLPTLSTQERFSWREGKDLNLSVEWGILPGLDFYFHYDYHSGPVEFYADSVAGIIPKYLDPTKVIGPAYDPSQVGWNRSLFMNISTFPRIITQPKDQTAELGTSAVMQVVASRATGYKWYRNGQFTGVTEAEIRLLAIEPNEGDYVVEVSNGNGQTFSEKARFAIATGSTKPEITAISPRSLLGKPLGQAQRITIVGSGFTSASRLHFHDGVTAFNETVPDIISSRELKYDLAVGPNAAAWTVKVGNGALESAPYAFNVTAAQDTAAPSAPIALAATVSQWSGESTVTLDWTNPSDLSGIAKAWLKVGEPPTSPTDGIAYPLPANKPLRLSLPISEGTRTLHIWLEDGAGNLDHLSRASTSSGVDAVSPVVRFTSPGSNPLTTTSGSIALSGAYEDNLSGVVSVKWHHAVLGSGDASTSGSDQTGTWNTPSIALQPGVNLVTVTATDAAGNIGSTTILITSLSTLNSGMVSVTLTPQGAIDQGAKWRVNGGQWRNHGELESSVPVGPRFVEFMSVPGGWRTPAGFVVNVNAGQTVNGNGNYTPILVNAPPDIPSTPFPAHGGGNVKRVQPVFTWSGADQDGPVEYAFCFDMNPDPGVYAGFGAIPENSFQHPSTLLAATTYYWRVKVRDNQGVVTTGPVWNFTTEYSYADLKPLQMSLDGNVAPDSNVTVSVLFTNQGTFQAPVGYVGFYLSRNPGAKELRLNPPISVVLNPPLNPGQSTNVSHVVTLNGLPAGQSFVDAWIDTTFAGPMGESDFNNNTTSLEINYIDGTNPKVTCVRLGDSLARTGSSNSILFSATDDTGVETMDFYYSTNGGGDWSPISEGHTFALPPDYGAAMPWLVPTNLPLITNLLIRVVARDGAGNWGEKTTGPYQLLDGVTQPRVTLIVPNGGETWGAGTLQQIQWAANSPDGIHSMNLNVYYGNSARFISDITTNTNGIFQWIVPSDLAATDARIRITLGDTKGRDTSDYSDGYFTIRDTSVVLQPWASPTKVTTVSPADPAGKQHSKPRIAVDGEGNVHMVYLYQSDYTSVPNILYRKRVGSTWTPPGVVTSVQMEGGDVSIAVDHQNNPHVVWHTGSADATLSDAFYMGLNGSSWSTPTNISANLPDCGGQPTFTGPPAIVIDSLNTLHLVWSDGVSPNRHLYHRHKDSSGNWSSIEQVTTGGGSLPSLATGTHNILHLVFWQSPDRISYMTMDESGWSSSANAIPFSKPGSYIDRIKLASSEDGTLHAIWRFIDVNPSSSQIRYASFSHGVWSPEETVAVSGDSMGAAMPTVALDSRGRPHIAWEDWQNPEALWYRFRNGNDWSPSNEVALEHPAHPPDE